MEFVGCINNVQRVYNTSDFDKFHVIIHVQINLFVIYKNTCMMFLITITDVKFWNPNDVHIDNTKFTYWNIQKLTCI